ncbi:MAG: NGG1p interacting factor NIF3, partial [Pseudomonas sp.]|nr:NGG1p interacting factor NIF3 [Pseudomonas sp.]
DELIQAVVAALKHSHPYETPAYDVWRLADI